MTQKFSKRIKYLEVASLALVVLFSFIIIVYDFFIYPNEPELYCFGKKINLFIWASPLILAVILEVCSLFVRKKHQLSIKKPLKKFLKFSLIILGVALSLSIIFVSCYGRREKAMDAKRMADLKQIYKGQEIFYDKKSRYADSQKELVEVGIFRAVATDPATGKQYTDKDGIGLEGSDDNPNTWSVQTILEAHKHEICSRKKTKKIYFCNQDGCQILILNR